jgi:hypothetical protein
MASCYITNGYTLDCRNESTGGIKALWMLGGSGSTISGVTTNASDEITAISGTGVFYKFELVRQSSSLTEDVLVNDTNQSIVFQPTVVVNLPKLNQSLRNLWFNLIKQNALYMIVLDNNDRYWAVGFENGVYVSAGQMLSGLSYSDANGVSLTFLGGEPNPSPEIVVTTTLSAVMSGITVNAN